MKLFSTLRTNSYKYTNRYKDLGVDLLYTFFMTVTLFSVSPLCSDKAHRPKTPFKIQNFKKPKFHPSLFQAPLFTSSQPRAPQESQTQKPKTIAILTYKVLGAKPWDPDSIHSGITGSEEAVIYISQKLAKIGYNVLVVGSPPANSPHSLPQANPRYIDVLHDDKSQVDIAILWRDPFSGMEVKKRAKKVYLWPHDTFHTHLQNEAIDSFDDVLWLSEWQRQQWISINPQFSKFTNIYGNGLNPEQFGTVQPRKNPYSCIYGSNYARGLDVLLNIWPTVKRIYPKATLDIYYGWQHWGLLSPEKERQMRAQVDVYELLDVKDHGLVSHEELTQAYEKTSLWTYPCTAPETFCITAIRAQMTGCIPVVINGTGLKETVRHGYTCSNTSEYLLTLLTAMSQAEKKSLQDRTIMKDFVLNEYTWEKIALNWDKLFSLHMSADYIEKDTSLKVACK